MDASHPLPAHLCSSTGCQKKSFIVCSNDTRSVTCRISHSLNLRVSRERRTSLAQLRLTAALLRRPVPSLDQCPDLWVPNALAGWGKSFRGVTSATGTSLRKRPSSPDRDGMDSPENEGVVGSGPRPMRPMRPAAPQDREARESVLDKLVLGKRRLPSAHVRQARSTHLHARVGRLQEPSLLNAGRARASLASTPTTASQPPGPRAYQLDRRPLAPPPPWRPSPPRGG